MIIIESYILKPTHIRGGENVLEPITTFGGIKSNIIVNGDGSGQIIYNNSDYTISLSNDLIVGATSKFTISNVSNSDTVQLYEDSELVSTTTGNTVNYTPSVAGEHEIYFKINNVSTNSITVTAYTMTSLTHTKVGIQSGNSDAYVYFAGYFKITLKPNIREDVVLNNIPCTVTYGEYTEECSVSNSGTEISIPTQKVSCQSPTTLTIACGSYTFTESIIEYMSFYKEMWGGAVHIEDLRELYPKKASLSVVEGEHSSTLAFASQSEPGILNINNSNAFNKDKVLSFTVDSNTTAPFVIVQDMSASDSVSLNIVSDDVVKIIIEKGNTTNAAHVYLNNQLVDSVSSATGFQLKIRSGTVLNMSNLIYGVE